MGHSDAELSVQFSDKMHHAQLYLRSEMNRLGLLEEDGWKIIQVTREGRGGTEMVLRPFHARLTAPVGLECVVWISADPIVDSECTAPERQPQSSSSASRP